MRRHTRLFSVIISRYLSSMCRWLYGVAHSIGSFMCTYYDEWQKISLQYVIQYNQYLIRYYGLLISLPLFHLFPIKKKNTQPTHNPRNPQTKQNTLQGTQSLDGRIGERIQQTRTSKKLEIFVRRILIKHAFNGLCTRKKLHNSC